MTFLLQAVVISTFFYFLTHLWIPRDQFSSFVLCVCVCNLEMEMKGFLGQLTQLTVSRPKKKKKNINYQTCHLVFHVYKTYRMISPVSLQFSSVAQSCPTLCDPMNCSTPGSSLHGILQARVLVWGAIAFSGSFLPTNI